MALRGTLNFIMTVLFYVGISYGLWHFLGDIGISSTGYLVIGGCIAIVLFGLWRMWTGDMTHIGGPLFFAFCVGIAVFAFVVYLVGFLGELWP